jgi:PAS domain S-box-containing protein
MRRRWQDSPLDRPVSVVIADDDPSVREAVADLLSDDPSLKLVAVTSSADEAIQAVADHRPDVVLLDVRMPGGGGARALREIPRRSSQTRVLALSAYEDKGTIFEMLELGASGYLVKGASDGEIVEAIHRTARGQISMSADLATACFQELIRDVKERKQTEAVLRRSEEKFRGLLESAPDAMVVVDEQGVIQDANAQVERIFRYEREELKGQPIEVLLPERLRTIHIRHRDGYLSGPQARPMGVGLDLAGRRKDGSEFPVDISLSPLQTEEGLLVVAGVRDITERRRAEELQRKSEERIRALVESSPDGMVIADAGGIIQLVNAQTEELFGYPREEMLGKPVEMLLPERFRPAHVTHRARFVEQPQMRPMGVGLELAGRRKNGSEFPVDISLSHISTDEGRLLIARVRDVTAGRRAEAELAASFELVRKTGKERQELLAHLVRAQEEERLRIASDIHDDSIQAMTAAGLRLQQLRRRLTTVSEREALDKLEDAIQGSITRLRRLMFDLRPLALDRAGLAAALRAQLDRLRADANLEFELENQLTTEPSSEIRVILYRIAMEALANVRKHARAHLVRVHMEEADRGWRVQVQDDGVGFIPPDGGSVPGHLGLTAIRERAQIAGGWCKVESSPGQGTTVSFWIPASSASLVPPQAVPA